MIAKPGNCKGIVRELISSMRIRDLILNAGIDHRSLHVFQSVRLHCLLLLMGSSSTYLFRIT